MLMYEGFLNKIYPRYKLADAFISFINMLEPSLKCYTQIGNYGLTIKSEDKILINIGKKATNYPYEFGGPVKTIDITVFPDSMNENISDFLINYSKDTETSFTIEVNDINYFIINYLTKEKYEKFLLKKDADKYNI